MEHFPPIAPSETLPKKQKDNFGTTHPLVSKNCRRMLTYYGRTKKDGGRRCERVGAELCVAFLAGRQTAFWGFSVSRLQSASCKCFVSAR